MKAGKRRVLLVDDDRHLRETLAEQLALHQEFETAQVDRGEAALEAAKGGAFDIVLLDVGLPDLDGREVCRRMRKEGITTPVIMLTAAGGEADTVKGLDSGANDYVAKPFKLSVLLARIRAQLRQHEQSEDAVFALGPYRFRPAAKILVEEGGKKRKIRLTEKETAILKFLYRAGDKAVSRETLLTEVWGYNPSVTTHTLETHIYRLRRKIEPNPAVARLLLTEIGGYRLDPGAKG
ncbi:MAG: response regulator transcription factor [Alphaproteobacteria bacterium]|nr:response regulator transcription factor [Alphaproteobacteria bacterium]